MNEESIWGRLVAWLRRTWKAIFAVVGRIWDVLWLSRVPVAVGAALVYVFLFEAQTRDAFRVVMQDVESGSSRGAWRVGGLLAAAGGGAMALWFWCRQSLRKVGPAGAGQPKWLCDHLPRICSVAPVFAMGVTLVFVSMFQFEYNKAGDLQWDFEYDATGAKVAALFFAAGAALYVLFYLRRLVPRRMPLRRAAQLLDRMDSDKAFEWMGYAGFGLAGVVIIFSLFRPENAYWFGPIGVLWLGAAFWATVLSQLAIWATRQKVPWLLIVALLGLWFGAKNWNDNHEIRHDRSPAKLLVETAPVTHTSVVEGYRAWQQEQPGADQPIILVAAEGGGIYAAYHSAYLLARLNEETQGAFGRRVFMLSSVSGGSVGCGVFVSLLAADRSGAPGRPVEFSRATRAILEADLLSPLLLAAVGPDALQRFLPFKVPRLDRARALEDTLEHRWREAEQAWLPPGDPAKRIDWSSKGSIWDLWLKPDGKTLRTDLPALFVNTVVVETGGCAVIGPYGVPSVDDIQEGQEQPPTIFHLWAAAPDLRIPIPTALGLSARFPYVTPHGGLARIRLRPVDIGLPPGNVHGKDWRFADGGYYDNTGIETVLATLQVLKHGKDLVDATGQLDKRVRVLIINAKDKSEVPNNEGQSDLLTPVRALLRVRSGRSGLTHLHLSERVKPAQQSLSTLQTNSVPRIDRRPYASKQNTPPDIPLGWMLSENSSQEIRRQVEASLPRILRELGLQAALPPASPSPRPPLTHN